MTAARYPHQSMVFWVIVGVITVLCGIVMFFGSNSGWFTVHSEITTLAQTQIAPRPFLFGIDPTILSLLLMIVGCAIATLSFFALGEPQEIPTTKYCPHCKRRL